MALTAYQRTLTQADVDALCEAGRRVWRARTGRARQGRFVWRQKRFRVTHTTFRLCIREANGAPVACCYD